MALICASLSDSDKRVDGDSAASVSVVGDGKEGSDVILVEVEIKAALIGVNVRKVGEIGVWKIVPIGGSDVGIDVVADLISGEGWSAAHWSASAGGTDRRRADESAGDGQMDKGQKEKSSKWLHSQ